MQPRNSLQHYVVATIFLVLAACSSEAPPPGEADSRRLGAAIVSAGGERLQGEVLDPATGLSVFRGIPYAVPPVGPLRWRPPEPHSPRAGEQDATRFGPACPQGQGNHDWYRSVAELFGKPPETIGPLEHVDEDCLYLNVWTANLQATDKQPVMVWIYGGANMNGYAHEPNYLGHNVAERGVVHVSMNYRVGAMGYLAHPGLAAESALGISGNYGILDIVAALQWVQENIAQFGGDPGNVTIYGESAGGANAATLIASPLGEGLFHRAIIQSGAYNVDTFTTQYEAQEIGEKIAIHLGFESPLSAVEIVDGMRELAWQDIVSGAASADVGWYSSVVIDGHVLPAATAELLSRDELRDIDLLIGSNANENYMYQDEDINKDAVLEYLDSFGEPYAGELNALLAEDIDSNFRLAEDRLSGASFFLCPSKFLANQLARRGSNVYFYHFTRIRPGGDRILAYHGAEIPYANDTADDWLPADEVDARLTDAMSAYWVNFARTGSPNRAGLPEWPGYSADAGAYMELGDDIVAGSELETQICDIMDRRRMERLGRALD